MHRFYLPPTECSGETLALTEGEAHHAVRVLRIRSGESVEVLNGAGRRFQCTVVDAAKSRVVLRIDQARDLPRPPWEITLAQALPKGKLFESIIQKATELGVSRIVPLLGERVVTQVDEDGAAHKAEKWRQVAIEAIKQCGSGWLPQIETLTTPGEFANCPMQFDLDLVAALQPGSEHLRTHLVKFSSREGRPPRSVRVWVGPEGDFTPAEYGLIQRGGALLITLGHLVLRVETAAIYSLAIVNHELQAAHNFIPGAQFVPSGKL